MCSIRWSNRLGEFVVPYQQALESEANHLPMHLYLQGLLSHLPRKNAEDIATIVEVGAPGHPRLHRHGALGYRPLVTVLVGQWRSVGRTRWHHRLRSEQLPQARHAFSGVKRQWCGHRGKVDNCQVGVFMGYVSRHDHALLDFRLYLPQEWAWDEQRRLVCHVPPAVRYHTRHEQCLAMLDQWGGSGTTRLGDG